MIFMPSLVGTFMARILPLSCEYHYSEFTPLSNCSYKLRDRVSTIDNCLFVIYIPQCCRNSIVPCACIMYSMTSFMSEPAADDVNGISYITGSRYSDLVIEIRL